MFDNLKRDLKRDIAIDFYAWVFPKKRYQLIKMISGKAAFLESIQKELDEQKNENL